MDEKVKLWLYDMLKAIEEIEAFFELGERKFENYLADIKTKRAIERNLEIIGEAASRGLKIDPDIQISHVKQIIGTRNRIIHGYDSVSDEMVWSIVINHLPKLKKELEQLLK
jgi:uncharacterized protein with HEPN domain